MKTMFTLITALLLMLVQSNTTASPKRFVYTGDPISITLTVDQEQRVSFPDTQIVWGDVEKTKGLLTTDIINNEVYFTPSKNFKPARVLIGEEGKSKIYLLNISASYKKQGHRRMIVVDGDDPYSKESQKKKEKEQATLVPALQGKSKTPTTGYASLFKYAAREVYAPDRLRGGISGVHKTAIDRREVFHLLRRNEVRTLPIAAWRTGSLYVTALSVRNNRANRVSLDPRELRGHWKAILFHHGQLMPKGQVGDNTTLYLISNKPFKKAINANPMIKVGRR